MIKTVQREDKLLIADDVFDTAHTINAVIEHPRKKARLNTPHDIPVAVPYCYLHETEAWLKYPHSQEVLIAEEIAENRPKLYSIVKDHL